MRALKTQSRTARRSGEPRLADDLMRTAVLLWLDANYSRDERRHRHLAYSYLRGRTYHQCEQTCREAPSLQGIVTYAGDYLPEESIKDDIKGWLTNGGITRYDQHPRVEAALSTEVA